MEANKYIKEIENLLKEISLENRSLCKLYRHNILSGILYDLNKIKSTLGYEVYEGSKSISLSRNYVMFETKKDSVMSTEKLIDKVSKNLIMFKIDSLKEGSEAIEDIIFSELEGVENQKIINFLEKLLCH